MEERFEKRLYKYKWKIMVGSLEAPKHEREDVCILNSTHMNEVMNLKHQ